MSTVFTPKVREVNKSIEPDYLKLGNDFRKEKRFEEAVLNFEQVLQINPRSIPARLAIGNIHFKLKRFDDALIKFQEIIQLDPLMPEPILKAGKIYLKQGKLDKAVEHFQNFLNLVPRIRYYQGYLNIGKVFLKQQNYEAAIEQFHKALSLNPQNVLVRLQIVKAYKAQGKLQEAVKELQVAKNINPETWRIYTILGSIYLEQKQYTIARDAFKQAFNLNSKLPFVKLGLAEALIGSNQMKEATKILKKISERQDTAPRKHKLFGDIYYLQNLFQEATEEYRSTILLLSKENNPEQIDNINLLAKPDNSKWKELAETYRNLALTALKTN